MGTADGYKMARAISDVTKHSVDVKVNFPRLRNATITGNSEFSFMDFEMKEKYVMDEEYKNQSKLMLMFLI